MKSYRKELWFNVPGRRAFLNITPQVEECLRESGVAEGLVLVNAMHITADNADAHIKRQVMGREVVVAITKGRLDFGPWEQIFYGEFDGGRRKRVLVKIVGE
jgi:thiamine phosphate synthase YjbQ (UPF0047 family)